ncbi:hypothetical protein EUTSA_v10027083mg [Eutrema salsugineum]|uniref:SURP motif domain-containing protein n=1 Tax=Eutrema salsugineum TaxID=72664 RepID=V4MH89_EUTSA|nr:hypothetical protein EUTSA_v10027083mg [Eutrema salsugineum]
MTITQSYELLWTETTGPILKARCKKEMSSSTQNEAPIIVEKTARFASKNGLEIEKMIIASSPEDARFNFLRSTEDPFHEIYQQKLEEYLAQDGSQDIQETETNDHSIQIIEPPPGRFRKIVETTALLVSKKGIKAERSIERTLMYTDVINPSYNFNFVKTSDPYHPFYQ